MMENLSLSIPGIGWITMGEMNQGTPMMTYAETDPDTGCQTTYMSLYRQSKVYKADYPVANALNDLPGLLDIDLDAILAEMLGRR